MLGDAVQLRHIGLDPHQNFVGDFGRLVEVEPPSGEGQEQADRGENQERFPAGEILLSHHGFGPQIDLQRAVFVGPQRGPHQFAERVCLTGNRLRDAHAVHGHVAQRVEKLDGRLEFFAKKFHHVGEADGAPTKDDSHRLASCLAGAVEADRPRDFRVQARHGIADDLGDPCFRGVARFGIRAAETHGAFLHFDPLGQRDVLMEFLGNGGADGVAADRNAPAEGPGSLDKNEVRRPRPDIDDQRAAGGFRVIKTESIIDRHRRDIDDPRFQPPRCHRVGHLGQLVRLHGDKNDIPVPVTLGAHDLVVPDHLVDRERHVLLRLERDDRAHVLGRSSGQLDEAGKNRLRRQAEIDGLLGGDFERFAEFLDRLLDLGGAGRVGRRVGDEFRHLEGVEAEPAVGELVKFGQTHRLHAEIESVDS